MRGVSDLYDAQSSRGKELISLYVNDNDTLSNIESIINSKIDQLEDFEQNDRMRYSLEKSLDLIRNKLNQFQELPENGLIIFCGRINGEYKLECFYDELKNSVSETRYARGRRFLTEPIQDLVSTNSGYLLIVLEFGDCIFGSLDGQEVRIMDSIDEDVPSKHSKGGQSQARFERRREQIKMGFFSRVSDRIKSISEYRNIEFIFIGGTEITVKEFLNNWDKSDRFEVEICSNVSYTNRTGINRIAEKAIKHKERRQAQIEQSAIENLFSAIKNDGTSVVYGNEDVKYAIDLGAVSKLLIHEDVYDQELVERAESIGSEVIEISSNSEKSKMFKNGFNGIGAELRYQISN